MKTLFKILFVSSFLLFSNCATIISGSRQTIIISSQPSSAVVQINEVNAGKTPLEKSLKRNQDYRVSIKLDGYQPYETLISKEFNAWALGNIFIGGIIGIVVDLATGAVYKLSPKELNASLSKGTTFKTKGKDLYLAVTLDVDPNWEKIGQLEKTK